MTWGGVNVPGMGNNIRKLRKSHGWTQEDAANRFGMSKGGYLKLERGERRLTEQWIAKAAVVFGCSQHDVISEPRVIPVVGEVGAGEMVYEIDSHVEGAADCVEAPPGVGENAVGVRVRGMSMYPDLDPEDVIVYDVRYTSDFEQFVGRRVVVGLQDGRVYVKRVHLGSRTGLYSLSSSNPREPDIEDVVIAWIAPIAWIKPKW